MHSHILARLKAVLVAALLSSVAVTSVPVLAQSADGGATEENSILFDSTIAAGVDPSKATTVADPTLPTDQLDLLVKPLTVEELQVEAAAWLILAKAKANEIAKTEVAIKRINQTIADENAAIQAEEDAIKKLDEAEAAQAKATEGTPAYEGAAKKLEEAKKAVQEAIQKKKKAEDDKLKLGGDADIQAALQEARSKGLREQATDVLEQARAAREQLTAGSDAYTQATAKIDALNQALLTVKTAEEQLETAVPGSPEAQAITQELEAARQALTEAVQTIDPSVLEGSEIEIDAAEGKPEGEDAGDEPTGQSEQGETPQALEEKSKEELAAEKAELEAEKAKLEVLKEQLLANATTGLADQQALVDRLNLVLASIDDKGGDTAAYRKYISAISTLDIDVTDTEGLGVRLFSWLFSEEGGLRLVIGFGSFICIIVVSWGASIFLGRLSERMLARVGGMSKLFRGFTVTLIKRGIFVAGVFLALATIGVDLGPVLAVIGGASFILAFALQSNLGNFASGLMILVYKPFDVGDEVEVDGQWAIIKEVKLASTVLEAWSNGKLISIPNSTVWGSTIVNHTSRDGIRKLSEVLYIDGRSDIVKAKQIADDVLAAHPLVLKDYWHGSFAWKVKDVAEIYYIARTSSDDYWTAYEELLLQIHSRFREEGIPFSVPEYRVALNADSQSEPYTKALAAGGSQAEMGVEVEPD